MQFDLQFDYFLLLSVAVFTNFTNFAWLLYAKCNLTVFQLYVFYMQLHLSGYSISTTEADTLLFV